MKGALCTAILLGSLTTGEAGANLLVNGSFEEPVNTADFVVFDVTTQGIPGWLINQNNVDINRNNVLGSGIQAQDGAQWIDLNGFDRGTIAQIFLTVVGQTYALRFFYADNPFNNGTSQLGVEKTGNFAVRDANSAIIASGAFSHSTTTFADADWFDSGIIHFTATTTVTGLLFSGDADTGSTGPFLDSVSVTAVPAPATLSLVGLGLFGLWRSRGRREVRHG